MRVLDDLDGLARLSGEELGTSAWLEIDQDRVNRFADATGDHQWIHVDVERAAGGPFGGTIVHGYLTLSLIPFLSAQVLSFQTPGASLNYGVNKVRFPSPLRVGSRVRSRVVMGDVSDLPSGKQVTLRHTIEIEGADKPACVAETVVLLIAD
jgi:acyl dehydratase